MYSYLRDWRILNLNLLRFKDRSNSEGSGHRNPFSNYKKFVFKEKTFNPYCYHLMKEVNSPWIIPRGSDTTPLIWYSSVLLIVPLFHPPFSITTNPFLTVPPPSTKLNLILNFRSLYPKLPPNLLLSSFPQFIVRFHLSDSLIHLCPRSWSHIFPNPEPKICTILTLRKVYRSPVHTILIYPTEWRVSQFPWL